MSKHSVLSPARSDLSFWRARQDQPELLDQGAGTPQDACRSLAEAHRLNLASLGWWSLRAELLPRLAVLGSPISLLDLGTGSGGIPRLLARWARRKGMELSVTALDASLRHLECAAAAKSPAGELRPLCARAGELPLPPGAVDIVISSLFLHHFSPAEMGDLLRSAVSVSRRGLVMVDLVRGWIPLFSLRLVQPLLARHPITRHDGAASIRRAYRPAELLAITRQAGLETARVRQRVPSQMTLVIEK